MVWFALYIAGCAVAYAALVKIGVGFDFRTAVYSLMWPVMLTALAVAFVCLMMDDGLDDMEKEYCGDGKDPG